MAQGRSGVERPADWTLGNAGHLDAWSSQYETCSSCAQSSKVEGQSVLGSARDYFLFLFLGSYQSHPILEASLGLEVW